MAFPGTGKIWMNGTFVDWADAKIHIASHVVHYGSGVFEGARCYDTVNGPACFRLDAHMRRLIDSARIYRMDVAVRPADAHRRRHRPDPGQRVQGLLHPPADLSRLRLARRATRCPARWTSPSCCGSGGAYFTKEAIEEGLDVKISTWARNAPNTTPAMAKSVANYANAQLIKMEAVVDGYAEGIALDTHGNLSEGSGQNLFIVRDGVIHTPPIGNSVLSGITRDSVITIARDLGFEVREQVLPREMLYIADEVFFVGTAVEVTPIRSVDRIKVGRGPPRARSPRRSSSGSSRSCGATRPTRTAGCSP